MAKQRSQQHDGRSPVMLSANSKFNTRIALLIALLAGSVTVFAFAPFGLWPLQILALSVLFLLTLRAACCSDHELVRRRGEQRSCGIGGIYAPEDHHRVQAGIGVHR